MDKGLTIPKWVLINQTKISQMPQNLSAQIVCLSPKVWDFDEKKASLGVRSPCPVVYRRTVEGQKILQIIKLNKKNPI